VVTRRVAGHASLALGFVVLAFAACGIVVEGELRGRPLGVDTDPRQVIVVIWNHGFSPEAAGTYRPEAPPIIDRIVERNRDVVLFKQLRNAAWLGELDHSAYVDAAIASLVSTQRVPVENIILSGQSCGGWGSLQTAAYRYPDVGGIVVFAPTCHGKLPHPTRIHTRRVEEIDAFARRLRAPGTLFVYEGDSFYSADDWARFASSAEPQRAGLHVELLGRGRVLTVCNGCVADSHSAVWGEGFADAFFDTHLQPLIDRVRASIRSRDRGDEQARVTPPASPGDPAR
jgi:dienelactone hydrolase